MGWATKRGQECFGMIMPTESKEFRSAILPLTVLRNASVALMRLLVSNATYYKSFKLLTSSFKKIKYVVLIQIVLTISLVGHLLQIGGKAYHLKAKKN